MAELTTLARPYAKAVFDAAQDQNAVDQWDQALAFAAQVAADQEVKNILANPGLDLDQATRSALVDCSSPPSRSRSPFAACLRCAIAASAATARRMESPHDAEHTQRI